MKKNARWTVIVHEAAAEELAALDDSEYHRILDALHGLEEDPFRRRPGVNIRQLRDVGRGNSLYRLRVGDHRAIYATANESHEVQVLLVEDRKLGYDRMVARAMSRIRD